MILKIIFQHTSAILPEYKKQFLEYFKQLYQLPILRPILNLMATKAKNNLVEFKVEPSKVWNRLAGHCETEGVFDRVAKFFSRKNIILIKSITPEVIIHEIAHAAEKELQIDLDADFRRVLGLDMRQQHTNIQVERAVETIMKQQLKDYKADNVMEELFARYFELLAMSYEVNGWGQYQFYYKDISEYFKNTTKWIEEIFNDAVSKKIEEDVRKASKNFVKKLVPYQKEWIKKTKSIHSKTCKPDSIGKWTGITKSTGDWEKSWKQYEEGNK